MHFNKLTPAEAERLAILAEECGEVVQAVGKILRHGYESECPVTFITNRDNLMKELADVVLIIDKMRKASDINREQMLVYYGKKEERIQQYLHHN